MPYKGRRLVDGVLAWVRGWHLPSLADTIAAVRRELSSAQAAWRPSSCSCWACASRHAPGRRDHRLQRALVLGDDAASMSWAFVLEKIDERSTRLITRSRGAYDRLALGLMLKVIWHPVHFGMQRRQLLNLKRRMEAAA